MSSEHLQYAEPQSVGNVGETPLRSFTVSVRPPSGDTQGRVYAPEALSEGYVLVDDHSPVFRTPASRVSRMMRRAEQRAQRGFLDIEGQPDGLEFRTCAREILTQPGAPSPSSCCSTSHKRSFSMIPTKSILSQNETRRGPHFLDPCEKVPPGQQCCLASVPKKLSSFWKASPTAEESAHRCDFKISQQPFVPPPAFPNPPPSEKVNPIEENENRFERQKQVLDMQQRSLDHQRELQEKQAQFHAKQKELQALHEDELQERHEQLHRELFLQEQEQQLMKMQERVNKQRSEIEALNASASMRHSHNLHMNEIKAKLADQMHFFQAPGPSSQSGRKQKRPPSNSLCQLLCGLARPIDPCGGSQEVFGASVSMHRHTPSLPQPPPHCSMTTPTPTTTRRQTTTSLSPPTATLPSQSHPPQSAYYHPQSANFSSTPRWGSPIQSQAINQSGYNESGRQSNLQSQAGSRQSHIPAQSYTDSLRHSQMPVQSPVSHSDDYALTGGSSHALSPNSFHHQSTNRQSDNFPGSRQSVPPLYQSGQRQSGATQAFPSVPWQAASTAGGGNIPTAYNQQSGMISSVGQSGGGATPRQPSQLQPQMGQGGQQTSQPWHSGSSLMPADGPMYPPGGLSYQPDNSHTGIGGPPGAPSQTLQQFQQQPPPQFQQPLQQFQQQPPQFQQPFQFQQQPPQFQQPLQQFQQEGVAVSYNGNVQQVSVAQPQQQCQIAGQVEGLVFPQNTVQMAPPAQMQMATPTMQVVSPAQMQMATPTMQVVPPAQMQMATPTMQVVSPAQMQMATPTMQVVSPMVPQVEVASETIPALLQPTPMPMFLDQSGIPAGAAVPVYQTAVHQQTLPVVF